MLSLTIGFTALIGASAALIWYWGRTAPVQKDDDDPYGPYR